MIKKLTNIIITWKERGTYFNFCKIPMHEIGWMGSCDIEEKMQSQATKVMHQRKIRDFMFDHALL